MTHQSNSMAQREAEPIILALLGAQLGVKLDSKTLHLPGGSRVDIDGVAPDESVLVEVFAHQGRLRGAQFHKVARDALKLITVARNRDQAPRMILAFADEEAAACVTGRSWLAEALTVWSVEPFVVELDAARRAGLHAAQVRQVMVNPPE